NGSTTKSPNATILGSREAVERSTPYVSTTSTSKTNPANVTPNCHGNGRATPVKNRSSPLTGSQNTQGEFAVLSKGTACQKRCTPTASPELLNDTPPGVAGA